MKVNEILTQKFVDTIKASGKLPWQRPWKIHELQNGVTGHRYTGLNVIYLSLAGKDTQFASFLQVKGKGGRVNEGAKSVMVVFYKKLGVETGGVKADGTPEMKTIPLLRYTPVFNLSDTTIDRRPSPQITLGSVQGILDACGVPVEFGGNRACYYPLTHSIQMPPLREFSSEGHFAATLFHEIGHGLAKETGVILGNEFGRELYSKEELVAELFSNFCLSHCGIDSTGLFDNSTAYLQNWLGALNDDVNLIIRASSQAQKRFGLLLGKLGVKSPGIETETGGE